MQIYDRCMTHITFSNHSIPNPNHKTQLYNIHKQGIISYHTIPYNIPEDWLLANNSVFVRKVM